MLARWFPFHAGNLPQPRAMLATQRQRAADPYPTTIPPTQQSGRYLSLSETLLQVAYEGAPQTPVQQRFMARL